MKASSPSLGVALLSLLALRAMPALGAEEPPPSPPASPALAAPEITVAAPEPRYVAPTRRDRIGRIWAPVYLDGKGPFRLVLDTGANRSAVIEHVAEALGNGARTNSTVRLRGVTGTSIVPLIQVREMSIGDLLLAPIKLPVVLDVFGGADGVLGTEGLHDKRVAIDFRHDSITIRRSRRERPGGEFKAVPMRFARDYLPIVEVRVAGMTIKAIIDTGAPDSLGNQALLDLLRRRARDSTTTEIVGVTLDVESGDRIRLPTLYLGGVRIDGLSANFADVYIFKHWHMTDEPALMLGMDVLGVMEEIIIDYRMRELYLKAPAG
jgi:predicted aspartyl protease